MLKFKKFKVLKLKSKSAALHWINLHRLILAFISGGIIIALIQGSSPGPVATKTSSENQNTKGKFSSVTKQSLGTDLKAKKFAAAVIDDNDEVWFLTDAGIVNSKFTIVNKSIKQPNDLVYESSREGPGFWIATPGGVVFAPLPLTTGSSVTTYNTGNSSILSDNVLAIITGKNNLRWFGTDKGISALSDKKWLSPEYMRDYPFDMFKDYTITSMATSQNGDSLFVATVGAGIARVFKNNVDGISGASSYAQWGPIELPSDNVYSMYIDNDSVQWFGTDMGVGKHVGFNTLENWTIYNTENGLVNDFVQAIAIDTEGKVWFGTKGGISVFDGTEWSSYTMSEGLISDNILFITVDKKGKIYIGTDNGLMTYNKGDLVCYQ
jgi:ligand-binding sensor domain-containing protein